MVREDHLDTDGELYTDVMVDIETTGTDPSRTAILQISAVKFNLQKRQVCIDFFDQCLSQPPHRFWDEGTRHWWATKNRTTLNDILSRRQPYQDVMSNLGQWAGYNNGGIRFWSKPITFDYSFIASYFNDVELPNPFHYRNAVDIRSYLNGLHAPEGLKDGYEKEVPFVGSQHNALDDTLHQVKVLFHYYDLWEKNNAISTR